MSADTDREMFGPVRSPEDYARQRRRVYYRLACAFEAEQRIVEELCIDLDRPGMSADERKQSEQEINDVGRMFHILSKLAVYCWGAAAVEKPRPLSETLDASAANAIGKPTEGLTQ